MPDAYTKNSHLAGAFIRGAKDAVLGWTPQVRQHGPRPMPLEEQLAYSDGYTAGLAKRESLPGQKLDGDGLDALFDHLKRLITVDTDTFEATGCDHTLRYTKAWLTKTGRNTPAIVEWLEAQGVMCDCEVIWVAAFQYAFKQVRRETDHD